MVIKGVIIRLGVAGGEVVAQDLLGLDPLQEVLLLLLVQRLSGQHLLLQTLQLPIEHLLPLHLQLSRVFLPRLHLVGEGHVPIENLSWLLGFGEVLTSMLIELGSAHLGPLLVHVVYYVYLINILVF